VFRYEVQLVGRAEDDYDRHLDAVAAAKVRGMIGYRSYFFGGLRNLIVMLSRKDDMQTILRAVPTFAVVGAWEIGAGSHSRAA
jgi:hypothetical protein